MNSQTMDLFSTQDAEAGAVQAQTGEAMLVFEQPINERVRSFLRLEFLNTRLQHTINGESEWDSRSSIDVLLDILSMLGRGDIKTELIKELERQTTSLEKLRDKPGVDATLLEGLVDELRYYYRRLYDHSGQLGSELKHNELIKSISQRSSMAGGTSHIDLPNYYYWLEQPAPWRIDYLKSWLNTLDPLMPAIQLVLKLIRNSSTPSNEFAPGGIFSRELDTEGQFQMIQVLVPQSEKCIAEISGGKYRANVRFLDPGLDERPVSCGRDIHFQLSCCSL